MKKRNTQNVKDVSEQAKGMLVGLLFLIGIVIFFKLNVAELISLPKVFGSGLISASVLVVFGKLFSIKSSFK